MAANAKAQQKGTKQNVGTTKALAPKQAIEVIPQQKSFEQIIEHTEEMNKLRSLYGRLKVKRDDVATALNTMRSQAKGTLDQFDDTGEESFDYRILLVRKDDGGNPISTIKEHKTVIRFTEHLLREMDELVELFKEDIKSLSERFSS